MYKVRTFIDIAYRRQEGPSDYNLGELRKA